MRLKRLEIYGFKSFADRVEMVFPDGVTGVVGPNGSGKSNIADAVRWVLGEQSAKTLRGAKMEDVIFGGTQKRKAQAYCEVSLVFDNEDGALPVSFAEVMITRRVYRNGDSEYCLNKAPCRLKDIVDLLRDTGIGKEGYSLIGQGRIDEILSVKSEERRAVFEEAAGITKYKARRAEAERRLENTDQNLLRVEDILSEVGSRLPELEKQAGDARRYRRCAEELRSLELSAFACGHDRLTENLEQAAQQIAGAQSEAQAAEEKTEALKRQSAEKEQAVAAADKRLGGLHARALEDTRACEIHEGEAKLLRERIESAEKEIGRLTGEREQDESRRGDLQRQRQESRSRQEKYAKDLEALRGEIAALEQAVEAAAADVGRREETLERSKEEMIRSFNALSDVKSAQARLAATREGLQTRLAALEGGAQAQKEELEAALSAQESAQDALQAAQEASEALNAARDEAMDRLAALQVESQQIGGNIQRSAGALREAQSRLKMLEQMQRDYEGYQNSVREVLRRFRGAQGLYGVVAGLMRVPKEIERAVEMALGPAMQNIVCAREEDAKVMIDYLRQNRMGRATFLPLSSVRGRVLSMQERQVLSMEGCLGLASELVRYDERFRPIAENLLGRTVIARDLDAGIAIMRAGRHAFRLVTLQGDVMHSGGSMTGGSVSARSTSILSRQREIDEHRAACETLKKRGEALEARVESLKEDLHRAQEAVSAARERAHEQDIAVAREQERLQRARDAVSAARERGEKAALEREQLASSIAGIDEELRGMDARTGSAERLSATTQEDIARMGAELTRAREALEERRAVLAERRATEAGRQAEWEMACRDETRVAGSEQELRAAGEIRERSRRALQERTAADKARLADREAQVQRLRQSLERQKDALEEETQARETLRREISSLLQSAEDARARAASARESLHRLEIAREKWASELKQLQDRIWERYELTLENARPECLPDFDESAARGRMEELRKEIRGLGAVNVGALDEYEETRARYAEMEGQRDDLRKARRDLQEILDELQKKMEEQFREQFLRINEHFARTFTRLFGGGTARLQLQDDKDVLACGIDIVAQPPGKKLQLLSLLSGGERALTAIAILFAMLDIRPSPFCILDEIEAALDEANVANFADYLKQYSGNTQFIVITHRKGTMERCDALYGVAMEEKGVSRMVSVQLSDLEQQLEEEQHD